jgi:threonylcarbamoyladenosine tRNA methylthiotransferase MtaB
MGRGYDAAHLKRSLDLISRNFDDIAIGGDIIVGFPGEGEEEFLNTYKFIESNSFTHLHVFPYSPRPGTEAYDLGDPVLQEEKKRRLWELKNLIAEKNYQFRKNLLGKTFDIIVEKHNGFASGLTDNYIRVEVNSDYDKNTLIKIKINEVSRNKTFGSI